MERVVPVAGLPQAPLQVEAGPEVRFEGPFVGRRNGEASRGAARVPEKRA